MEYTGQSPLIATSHSHNGRQPARGAAPHACGKYGDHGWQRVYLHAPGTKAVAACAAHPPLCVMAASPRTPRRYGRRYLNT